MSRSVITLSAFTVCLLGATHWYVYATARSNAYETTSCVMRTIWADRSIRMLRSFEDDREQLTHMIEKMRKDLPRVADAAVRARSKTNDAARVRELQALADQARTLAR